MDSASGVHGGSGVGDGSRANGDPGAHDGAGGNGAPGAVDGAVIRSLIPARLDRIPWSKFHTRMIMALGVAWILDGLEITIAANLSAAFTQKSTLNLSTSQAADIATYYLIGEVIGALLFGRLSDKLGRKRLFVVTLGIYLVGSGLTAATQAGGGWIVFLYGTRIIAGMGIGGEYAAINSAIDEMMPARYRGRVDIAVNGTYWAGAILGTAATLWILNGISPDTGWRIAYLVGPVLAVVIVFVRKNLPESPRWLLMHGHAEQAESEIAVIEREAEQSRGPLPDVDDDAAIEIVPTERMGYLELVRTLFRTYPSRSTLVASLMATQSFLYNAIFFTYGLVLKFYFNVPVNQVPYYFFAFAAGNLAGPLTIGKLFDSIGRRKMISGTYVLAGSLLVLSAILFKDGDLNATTQTIAWTVIFFFASAGASAGYLTASEVFPLEVRAQAIAVFFAIAQCFGFAGTKLFGHLIGTGHDKNALFGGYLLGAGMMIAGGFVAAFLAVDAEGKSLEEIAPPLSLASKAHAPVPRPGPPVAPGGVASSDLA
ncbi:MAG: MFS transporter [Conexibacteraceae bacterium]|nr:MFS transporter [Conexibacteraceae bacterium]